MVNSLVATIGVRAISLPESRSSGLLHHTIIVAAHNVDENFIPLSRCFETEVPNKVTFGAAGTKFFASQCVSCR